jgi:dTDP-4-dehydrorhamnose 3,5-epimerase
MIFKKTKLKGIFIIELEKHRDERGYFARTWCRNEFKENGLNSNLAQANTALSFQKGTLRGMHYQIAPYEETKIIRCIRGSVFDVVIDIRPDSITYGQWLGVELSFENQTMLYVPEGFAHGYKTLENNSEVFYLVSQFYTPDAERGIRWDDPAFNITWPETSDLIISEKDKNWPDYLV